MRGWRLDRSAMSALPPLGDADAAARAVFDQVAGFGPLQQYFDDPGGREALDGVSIGTGLGLIDSCGTCASSWNAMSTTTKIALVGAFIGLVG